MVKPLRTFPIWSHAHFRGDLAEEPNHLDILVVEVLEHHPLDTDPLELREALDDLVDGPLDQGAGLCPSTEPSTLLDAIAHLPAVAPDDTRFCHGEHERRAPRSSAARATIAARSRASSSEGETALYSSAKRTAAATVRGFARPPMMIGGRGLWIGCGRTSGAAVH